MLKNDIDNIDCEIDMENQNQRMKPMIVQGSVRKYL